MLQSINLYNQLAKNKLFSKSVNFDLRRIKLVLKKLGNPENKLKNVINIIGSDGKYSLLTSLKFFLEANKQNTSAFISPSLKSIRERFWMGDKYLTYKEIQKTIITIEKCKIPLTIFEVLTVVFVINAAKKNNEYNLIEAGALFAKDSTNIFDYPLLQAVVNINKQHLNFLKKKTISEIVYQKVAFLSKFTNIYVGKQTPRVNKIIKRNLKINPSKKIFNNSWRVVKFKNHYFYNDKNIKIKLNTKYINSKGLIENLAMAIRIALDLGVKKKTIQKTIPKIYFEGRVDFLRKGKIKKKLYKNEKILLDGCHSEVSAKNLAKYLKKTKVCKYGIWGMIKNKNPDLFIKQFSGVFEKIITIPIDTKKESISPKLLLKIAKKNKFKAEMAKNFDNAIKILSSRKEKIICVFGSLYLCGIVLNKN